MNFMNIVHGTVLCYDANLKIVANTYDYTSQSQKWRTEDAGNGYVRIQNVANGLYITNDIDNDCHLKPLDEGNPLQQWCFPIVDAYVGNSPYGSIHRVILSKLTDGSQAPGKLTQGGRVLDLYNGAPDADAAVINIPFEPSSPDNQIWEHMDDPNEHTSCPGVYECP